MGPDSGINLNKVSYFSMEEYIDNIKLNNDLLMHLDETSKNFDKYLKLLASLGNETMIYYWIDSLAKEMGYSQRIENSKIILPSEIYKRGVFFDTLQMNHTRIKNLHQFVTKSDVSSEYRTKENRVSSLNEDGSEIIYWYGVDAKDVKAFLDDFIKIYKSSSTSLVKSNPFLKSALIHLLFVRIHPFSDGNGRTARIIQNIKFTDLINRTYGMNLKICPLNLSQSILINKSTYVKRINNIYFDLYHDINDEINQWFNFMLDMVDEQVYYGTSKLSNSPRLEKIDEMVEEDMFGVSKKLKNMNIKI